ncbi:MAG: hypothetical protein ACR2PL_09685 [Dehalococcoidia bacterium]
MTTLQQNPEAQQSTALVALDGSAAAAAALPVARLVAEQLAARIEILYSAPTEATEADLRQQFGLAGISLDQMAFRQVAGPPAISILQALTHPRVALTVLTTYGRMRKPVGRSGGWRKP